VDSAKTNERTRKLLIASQHAEQAMKSQEEEIRQNMEEMSATQAEMERVQRSMVLEKQRIEDEFEAQLNIINNIAIVSKTDVQGNITYVNDNFLKWAKYSKEEVMGKNHRMLKSGDQDDAIFEEMWKTISSGKVFRGEIKNKAKDGSFYWVDAIVAPVLDKQGKPKEYIAQRFVINDQIKAREETQKMLEATRAQEEEIRQNMEEMTSIQEQMERVQIEMQAQNNIINSVAIVSKTDVQGNITYVNDEFLKWSKYSLEEVMGQNHRILKSGDQDDQIFVDMWKTISSGKIFRGEIKNKAKDGSFYWVDAIIAPILDENGKPKEYLAQRFVINDQIEARIEMQEMLEETRAQEEEIRQNMEEMSATQTQMERQNAIIAQNAAQQKGILDGIDATMATIEFKPDGTVVTANENFLNTTKYLLEDIKGKHHRMFVPKEVQLTDDYKTFWTDLADGEEKIGIFKRIDSDGKTLWLNAIYNPIKNAEGKVNKIIKFATDVTAQKEQEADLAAKMAGINATMATIEFTPEGIVVNANENFLTSMKCSLKDIYGKHHRNFVPKEIKESEDYSTFWSRLAAGIENKGIFKRINTKGDTVWLDAIYNPISDSEGKVIKVIKFATDITEKVELEAESKAQLDIINEIAIVSKTDLQGNITYVNEEFLKWSKYTIHEVIGKNHRMLKSGDQDDQIFVDMWKTISGGNVFRGEIKNKAKDGSFYWVDAIIAPILDENGKPKEYIAQRFVINDQKLKEQEMQEMLEETRAQEEEIRQSMEEMTTIQEQMERVQIEMQAQNNIINSIAIVSKTDVQGNITYVNEEFLKWSKYTEAEVIGQNHRMLKSGDQDDQIFVDMWKTISSGNIFRGEIKNKAKDGSFYWVDAIIAPVLDNAGKPREYIAQRFVINDQKEREAKLNELLNKK
jgi:PAS domain S-box-containing protein